MSTRLDLAHLDRLQDLLINKQGEVAVDLLFHEDSGRRAMVSGSLHARVTLTCQRCMGPVELEINPSIRLAVVSTEEEAERLPDELDPLFCPEGELRLSEMVQDELILALPIIVNHENHPTCRPLTSERPGGDGVQPERNNPFAALGALKSGGGNDDESNQGA